MTEETEVQESIQPSESETKATRLGWVPKDQFKGDPDKWRPAEEFLERGINMLPLLQRDNERLHKGMSRLEKRLEDQSRTFEEFQKFNQGALEREYKRGVAEANAKLDTAIQNADVAGAQQARRELAALEEAKPQPVKVEEKPKTAEIDSDIKEWMSENPWFNTNQTLAAYAGEIFGELEQTNADKTKKQLLAETKKRVMDKFPEKFGINPKREQAAAVASPNSGAPKKTNGRSFEDLPQEAKTAYQKYSKIFGKDYTKEKYLAAYQWD